MAKEAPNAAAVLPPRFQVEVKSARAESGKRQRILLIGRAKDGKTTCIASLSSKFPTDFPNHKEDVFLDDGFLVQFDVGGHDSIGGRRMDMPFVDLSQLTDAVEIEQSFYAAVAALRQRVMDGVTTFAGVDSISELCTKLVSSLKLRGLDGWDLWGEVAAINTRMFQRIQELPIDLVFTSHLVAKIIDPDDKDSKDAQTKKWSMALPGAGDLIVDIPGKTAGLYRRNCSMIIPVVCNRAGKNTAPTYTLYPNGSFGIEAGTRYALNDTEPAHLGRLLKKIRGTNAA
jgi:hypothetical protein